jgi:hypothetical protein
MKKFAIKFITVALAVSIPFITVIMIAFHSGQQFSNTFLGALADKYERLTALSNTDEPNPKIIIIGGSSTAFGLRSDLLEQELGMAVVNLGLYAELGTKFMLDISRAGIKSGDIIIIAPEIDSQTLSMHFNAETTWQALDGNLSMLRHVRYENYGALAGNFWDDAVSKLRFGRYGGLNPEGVYSRASFNQYGDIIYPRPYNIMLRNYNPNHLINLDPAILCDDFAEYLNEFVKFSERKGAEVYFNFPPMNRLAVPQYGDNDNDNEAVYDFYLHFTQMLDCEIIGNINHYIIDERYFYDSNYHLNDSGVLIRTALLAEDIKRALNRTEPVLIELPLPPERPVAEFMAGDDAYSEYFIYEEYAGGLIITGVSDEFDEVRVREINEITVPRFADGKPVIAIGERAFAFEGSDMLTTVIIHDNIVQLYDRIFDGCGNLEAVILIAVNANAIAVGEDLLGGTPESCRIYIPREGFGNFVADYFWSRYSGRMDILG